MDVKGPPPQMRTGCDMVVVFPLIRQAAVLASLKTADLEPEQVVSAHDVLLEPVSLFQTSRLEHWLMVRAANMKITVDCRDRRIVNISGGIGIVVTAPQLQLLQAVARMPYGIKETVTGKERRGIADGSNNQSLVYCTADDGHHLAGHRFVKPAEAADKNQCRIIFGHGIE